MDTPYEGFHLLLEASKIMDSRNRESKCKLIKDFSCNHIKLLLLLSLLLKMFFYATILKSNKHCSLIGCPFPCILLNLMFTFILYFLKVQKVISWLKGILTKRIF